MRSYQQFTANWFARNAVARPKASLLADIRHAVCRYNRRPSMTARSPQALNDFDVAVIGAGVVGCAVFRAFVLAGPCALFGHGFMVGA